MPTALNFSPEPLDLPRAAYSYEKEVHALPPVVRRTAGPGTSELMPLPLPPEGGGEVGLAADVADSDKEHSSLGDLSDEWDAQELDLGQALEVGGQVQDEGDASSGADINEVTSKKRKRGIRSSMKAKIVGKIVGKTKLGKRKQLARLQELEDKANRRTVGLLSSVIAIDSSDAPVAREVEGGAGSAGGRSTG